MIFFSVPVASKDISIDICEFTVPYIHRDTKDDVIVPWNCIFNVIDKLTKQFNYAASVDMMLDTIIGVANKDPVCKSYVLSFERVYNVNICDGQNILAAVMREKLFAWAHPLIGNLLNSPRIRPMVLVDQYKENWLNGNWMNSGAVDALKILMIAAPPLKLASRDQCRICGNIVELARAFIGEITSHFSKKIEKCFAIKLCSSEKLLSLQRHMINSYVEQKEKWNQNVIVTLRSSGLHALEYGRYYLPNDAALVTGTSAVGIFMAMVSSALEGSHAPPEMDDIGQRCMVAWGRLPPVIRCTALMNDLRKLGVRHDEPKGRFSMSEQGIALIKGPKVDLLQYTVGVAAGKSSVPRFTGKGSDLSWSWNRDEAHDATISYRYSLCPLWAGPSGHTTGGISFWKTVLGTAFPQEGSVGICAGLFTLWRLYYDRRISCSHTLAETFEASCRSPVNSKVMNVSSIGDGEWGDAFDLVLANTIVCKDEGVQTMGGDPIAIMQALLARSPRSLEQIDDLLGVEQKALAKKGYWLPRWSRELTGKTGVDVFSFPSSQKELALSAQTEPLILPQTVLDIVFDGPPLDFVVTIMQAPVHEVSPVPPPQETDPVLEFHAKTTVVPLDTETDFTIAVKVEAPWASSQQMECFRPLVRGRIRGGQSLKVNISLA